MEIIRERCHDTWVLTLSGPLTLGAGVPLLRSALESLPPGETPRIVLDLTGVEYVDAAGIGELMRAHLSILQRGGQDMLAGLHGEAEEAFALTGLLGEVPRAENSGEACQRMAARGGVGHNARHAAEPASH